MQNPTPDFPYKSKKLASNSSLMDYNQLMDSLTAHISLYHSSSSPSDSNRNPNPRSAILKWFSSLTVHQRLAHLTTIDSNFVQILLLMQGKLQQHGHGFFIILPDMPSRDRPGLPSLCYRRSHGLLARFSESNESERSINEAIRLFNSREGEGVEGCSCSANSLDSMTVREEFVEDVDRFVAAMDAVSSGGFLRGEVTGLRSDWVELDWLKAKGYYGIEAFAANRLEVALRLSWLNCNSGKKRGAKSKEKVGAAGVAANAFWRKKGCMDWWMKQDAETKRKVYRTFIGKAAKSLMAEIVIGAKTALEDEKWLFRAGPEQPLKYDCMLSRKRTIPKLVGTGLNYGSTATPSSVYQKPFSETHLCYRLFVLQDILALLSACLHSEYDKGILFFSSLGSVGTITDCILRKLRGVLMMVSLDCTKYELLEEGNLKYPPKKSKEKPSASSRRKKGKTRTKRVIAVPRSSGEDLPLDAPPKMFQDHENRLVEIESSDTSVSHLLDGTHQRNNLAGDFTSSATDMERGQVLVNGYVQAAAGESSEGSNAIKNSGIKDKAEVGNCQMGAMEVSSAGVISEVETANCSWMSEKLVGHPISNISTISDKGLPISSQCDSARVSIGKDSMPQSSEGEYVVDSKESRSMSGLKCSLFSDKKTKYQASSSIIESENCENDSNIISPVMPLRDIINALSNETMNCQNAVPVGKTDISSVFSGEPNKLVNPDEELTSIQEQDSVSNHGTGVVNCIGCPSYEWPAIAPVHYSSINSYLPAATDRLHLDVGHNWHNHFHQSFVPTVHQATNSSLENGSNRILSRPLPMSSDWPPVVRRVGGVAPSLTCSYDSGYMSRRQCSLQHGFTTQNVSRSATTIGDDRMYLGDGLELSDPKNTQEIVDETDNHWISEEEYEVHAVPGVDYNQYFGGGVMYWNPSDHHGTSFSRPPSLSSDDSSWAWREADMTRAVDDMVAFSSSYSTNGLASPSAASFCSPFDPLGSAHQAIGYVIPGSEVTGKVMHTSSTMTDVVAEENASVSLSNLPVDVETNAGDILPYPVLRPLVVPSMARERSRSDFKRGHDHKSPCVPPNRREQPRIKRPPSPVVLCVPRAPRPPPPSPVGDSRKHRGFPTVRSGSSSPRHWGVKGWFHDGVNFEEACVRMDGSEVVWPSWRNKSLSTGPMIQPLPGALLQDRLIAITQLARDQEHPDVAIRLQPPELLNCPTRIASLSLLYNILHDEIDSFCKQVATENMIRKPYVNWAVKRVTRSLQVLWPRSRTNIFGSNATGLSLPTSDVDLVVCLPPVRNLEPIKEAGILEGRNGIKETCLQHAARYLANQEWVKNDSLKIVENTAIPIIMLVVEVPHDLIISAASNVQTLKEEPSKIGGEQSNTFQTHIICSENSASPKCPQKSNDKGKDARSVRIDISFKSPSHTGLQTTELVKELTEQFTAATPLALVLKQFLADRTLDQSYSGGLSSYCLVLLITRFLQHEHHLGRPINQNFGGLLMDFLYFFGNVFDPRQMRISVQGSGVYINRERGYSIDPIYIDDPLFPANNVGRNCFRIHQCIKAFADAYSILENELAVLPSNGDSNTMPLYQLLPKIIPSVGLL